MQIEVLYYPGSEQQNVADRTCAFVVRIWHKQGFSWRGLCVSDVFIDETVQALTILFLYY